MALAALEGGIGTLEVLAVSLGVELGELLEGLVAEPIGTRVSSIFLLQPPNARAAARASAIALADLSADACIYVSLINWSGSIAASDQFICVCIVRRMRHPPKRM